jgi:hypothetical protein
MFPRKSFSIMPVRRSLRNLKRAMNPQPYIIRQTRRGPINSQPFLAAGRARAIAIISIPLTLDSRDSDSKLIRSQVRLPALIKRA